MLLRTKKTLRVRTEVLKQSAAAVTVKLTDGPEASHGSEERLSNVTESREKKIRLSQRRSRKQKRAEQSFK